MNLKIIVLLAIGFALKFVGHSLEVQGDLIPLESGNSMRLAYHLAALMMMLGAVACFIYAGISIFRAIRKKKDET